MTISVKQNNTYAAATGVWVKVNGVWKQVASDGLKGLGGWAEIKTVSGSPKRYAYNDGSTDWVAFEWTGDGSLTTQAGGLVDALIVGAGGNTDSGHSWSGTGGGVVDSVFQVGTTATVTVGQPGAGYTTTNNAGGFSQLGDMRIAGGTYAQQSKSQPNGYQSDISTDYHSGAGAGGDAPDPDTGGAGHSTAITSATPQVYARGGGKAPYSSPRPGDGADRQNNGGTAKGIAGVVIVRVPAAQAAGVSAGSWVTRIDYYAEVTDGIVTDLYQERFYGDDTVRTENGSYASPEQPDDLIPCDPSVAEGWTYADGEFTPPPPDPSLREQAIEALKQQIKDLQKDT